MNILGTIVHFILNFVAFVHLYLYNDPVVLRTQRS